VTTEETTENLSSNEAPSNGKASNGDSGWTKNENGSSSKGYQGSSTGGSSTGAPRNYSKGRGAAESEQKVGALEVTVDHNVEKAIKVLKRKLIKEGLFKELKMRRFYEKPSERRIRKDKESRKKIRKEEARNRRNTYLLS